MKRNSFLGNLGIDLLRKRSKSIPKGNSFLRFLSTLHSLALQLNTTATPEEERYTFPSMVNCSNLSAETSITQLL